MGTGRCGRVRRRGVCRGGFCGMVWVGRHGGWFRGVAG
jgi:hypothetical protein